MRKILKRQFRLFTTHLSWINSMSEIRPFRTISRRKSRQISVGKVLVGGDAPISVQSMTNTLTTDVKGTVKTN